MNEFLTVGELSIELNGTDMPDQPTSDRFKTEMPQIPGVSGPAARRVSGGNPAKRLVVVLVALLVIVVLGARWGLRPKPAETRASEQAPQIEVPPPAPDPTPHATDANPGIAEVAEMAKPWSAKEFYVRNRLSGADVAGLLVRLPTGSASQANGYWAFAINAPYGNCQLEFITDLDRLKNDYDFRAPRHPMVGNPCSRTVFDPLKMTNLPGDIWVRGAIAQGSDLRPPFGIELKVQGKSILAVRTE